MSGGDLLDVFDHRAVGLHRARSSRRFAEHAFLFHEVGARLVERLEDIRRDFPLTVELGSRDPMLADTLSATGKVGRLLRCAATPISLAAPPPAGSPGLITGEERLPFASRSLDLVISVMALHWVNDLPGLLVQIRDALKPDGLFLAALPGGETLRELRGVLLDAEVEEEGGASPRVSPFADLRDLGALLQRAQLALPVADSDTITVTYENAFALMRELRGMGESNAVRTRRRGFSRRATLMRAAALYQERHGDRDGRIPATFQICYLTGWAPHDSQPKALRPGSAAQRLADALETEEHPAGDKTSPG